LGSLPLAILVFLLLRIPLLPHAPKGVDVFFHLLAAKRFEGGLPRRLGAFIVGDEYTYPPLFHFLLSLIPEGARERAPLLIGIASDLGSMILVHAVSSALFGEAVAAIAALAYAVTPMNYIESIWQTPRPLGIFLYNLSMALLLLAPQPARPLAAPSIALLLLSHRLSAQALWLSSALLIPILIEGDPPAILWIPIGFALAIAASKGFYLKALKDHLEVIGFHLRYGEMGRGRKRPGNPPGFGQAQSLRRNTVLGPGGPWGALGRSAPLVARRGLDPLLRLDMGGWASISGLRIPPSVGALGPAIAPGIAGHPDRRRDGIGLRDIRDQGL